jgi:nitroreductase
MRTEGIVMTVGTGTASGGLDQASVESALTVAVRAPSIHNTQPWAWRLSGGILTLHADRSRQLAVADPDAHSLLISCGAALHLTELALRAAGWLVETAILPDASDPDLLASFRPVDRHDPDEHLLAEVDAALRRRSDRRPFAREPLPAATVEALQAAGRSGDARVDFPNSEDERIDLAVAVSWADRVERDDQAYLEEMNRWLRDPDVHAMQDGVPLDVVPHVPEDQPRHTDVPLRDFEVGMSGRQIIERDVDERPLIAVILTDFESATDHLRAGVAMMRLMIAAELGGLSSCPLSQAVDFAAFRTRVQRAMGWVGYPQMMLRIGYPASPASELVRTPRRDVSAVLAVG